MHGTRVRARARVSAGDPRRSPPYHIIIRTAGRARKADVSVSSRAARDEFLFFHTRRVAKPRVEPRGRTSRRTYSFTSSRSPSTRRRPRWPVVPPPPPPNSTSPRAVSPGGRRSPRLFAGGCRSRGRHRARARAHGVLVRLARVIPHLRERSHGLRATERGSGPGPVGRGATVHLRAPPTTAASCATRTRPARHLPNCSTCAPSLGFRTNPRARRRDRSRDRRRVRSRRRWTRRRTPTRGDRRDRASSTNDPNARSHQKPRSRRSWRRRTPGCSTVRDRRVRVRGRRSGRSSRSTRTRFAATAAATTTTRSAPPPRTFAGVHFLRFRALMTGSVSGNRRRRHRDRGEAQRRWKRDDGRGGGRRADGRRRAEERSAEFSRRRGEYTRSRGIARGVDGFASLRIPRRGTCAWCRVSPPRTPRPP